LFSEDLLFKLRIFSKKIINVKKYGKIFPDKNPPKTHNPIERILSIQDKEYSVLVDRNIDSVLLIVEIDKKIRKNLNLINICTFTVVF